MRGSARLGALAVMAGCALLSACTTDSTGTAASQSPSSSAPTSTSVSSAPDTVSPTTDATVSGTSPSASPSSTAPTSGTPSISASAVSRTTCTFAQLTVRALPGGAMQGQEVAAVTVTNSGSAECVMYGTPGVSLLLKGKALGSPAKPIGTPHPVDLAVGDTAQALITDDSSCSAPISDTVQITLSQLHATVNHPLQLRGCALQVAPFSASD